MLGEKKKKKQIYSTKEHFLAPGQGLFLAKSRVTNSKTPEANKEKHDGFLAG